MESESQQKNPENSLLPITQEIIEFSSIYLKEADKQLKALVPVGVMNEPQDISHSSEGQWFHGICFATS